MNGVTGGTTGEFVAVGVDDCLFAKRTSRASWLDSLLWRRSCCAAMSSPLVLPASSADATDMEAAAAAAAAESSSSAPSLLSSSRLWPDTFRTSSGFPVANEAAIWSKKLAHVNSNSCNNNYTAEK